VGLRDILGPLLGSSSIPGATHDGLFAIASAGISLESRGMRPGRAGGICFRPVDSAPFREAQEEIRDLLSLSSHETGTGFRFEEDEFRFTWVILEDEDFNDLVTGVHLISQTLTKQKFGAYLLCAIFRFEGEQAVYWIYSFKNGKFYPFIPDDGKRRDTAAELRAKTFFARELPVEEEMERWYPVWGIPF